MNPWYELFIYLFLFAVIIISGIISVVMIIRNRKKGRSVKRNVISLVVCCAFIASLLLLVAFHPTYYKFNDWTILNSSIYEVQDKYGNFDIGKITPMEAGKVLIIFILIFHEYNLLSPGANLGIKYCG